MKVTYWFSKNTTSKKAFPAFCLYLDAKIYLYEVNSRAPVGGKIGARDSLLHKYLKLSKVLSMHVIFHDAYGLMRSVKSVGPGDVSTITSEKYFRSSMQLDHFLGILFWTLMKNFNSQNFDEFLS